MTEVTNLLGLALGLEEDQRPFPWQEDLLSRLRRGEVPKALDVPTGLWKTSVMAIWLLARASGANVPRRLIYIVDRRAVVDQATDEAMRLLRVVDANPDLKSGLGLRADRSLPVSTLRGQYVDNREWLEDPAAPAIIVGTVDMVGSRLLFEGYGVSRKMRPYHAGLLGVDTLVVLDEAHLVPPFEHLLRTIATDPVFRPRDHGKDELIPPLRLLALSATGRAREAGNAGAAPDGIVGLTSQDHAHPEARRRLNARKSLRIESLEAGAKLEERLAERAWELTDAGRSAARILVFSDSREVAQKAKEAFEKLQRKASLHGANNTELLVGGRRVFEREEAKARLRSLGFIAGSKAALGYPVFLFATSAGEVGIDLDADHMVCDLVAWERMVQRFGRVNRRGERESHLAHIVVIPEHDPKNIEELLAKSPDKLTAKERETVDRIKRVRAAKRVLEQLPRSGEGVSVSPAALLELKERAAVDAMLHEMLEDATTPEPLRPALTRPLVEAWALTSLKEHPGRPEIQPWLRGWVDEEPQTAVVWRTYLPLRAGGAPPRGKDVEDFFEAAPPHTSELLETEMSRVLRWLIARGGDLRRQRGQTETAPSEALALRDEEVVAFALDRDGGLRGSFTFGDLASIGDRERRRETERLLAGATLVVDARLAGLKAGLLDEKESQPPRTADGGDWLGEGAIGFRVRSTDSWMPIRDANWHERLRLPVETTEEGEVTRWLVVEKWRENAATEEDRSSSSPQLLVEHESRAEARARSLAKALGLDDAHAEVLALAGALHDEGKRAERWQRAFHAPKDAVYAKTEGPINFQLLDGYRHELGSLLRIEGDQRVERLPVERRDLLLHLIAAHHGFSRPVIGTNGCDDAPPSALDDRVAEVALRFARLMDAWGPWGLAWWEALLRAADQQASREDGMRRATEGGE